MSNHSCNVVGIQLERHPNATALSIVRVGGYQCIVRTEDWNDGDLGVYIPPDSVVPDIDEFAFLGDNKRIKVRKFRGLYSQGLLIPAPVGAKIGDDLMDKIGISHYEPPLQMSTGGEDAKAPEGCFPVYDVENFNNYANVINPGEEVSISEKLHGASCRYRWQDGKLHVGSRKNWKKHDGKNIWSLAVEQNPWIVEWCKLHPYFTIYGEVFGRVQSLKYGAGINDIFFRVFDLWCGSQWVDYLSAKAYANSMGYHHLKDAPELKWVPELYRGPFDEKIARSLAECDSAIVGANHLSEGVVVRTITERYDDELGRVQLKIVSNRYLEKS